MRLLLPCHLCPHQRSGNDNRLHCSVILSTAKITPITGTLCAKAKGCQESILTKNAMQVTNIVRSCILGISLVLRGWRQTSIWELFQEGFAWPQRISSSKQPPQSN